MTPGTFVSTLGDVNLENVFNPYANRCPTYDKNDAPQIRSAILKSLLRAAWVTELDAIWIGRDLGYKGGRRTGLALTDDVHLSVHAQRWDVKAERPTNGKAVAERTASVVWKLLAGIDVPIFLWNVFPFHPHSAGKPFSNRSHNSKERSVGEEFLDELISLLRPRRLVAIGNDAMNSVIRIGGSREVVKVRHPSYGGNRQFVGQLRELYEVRLADHQRDLL